MAGTCTLSAEYLSSLDKVFDARSASVVFDYGRSRENYLVDIDGNEYLDVYSQIASIPVGYNNERLISAAQSPEMLAALVNRPAMGAFPSKDWLPNLRGGLLRIAPKGMDKVWTAHSGSEANELAFRAAFMLYQRRKRGEVNSFSPEEAQSCMLNSAPGSPLLAVMSFTNSLHGRGFASLSATRSKYLHKMDIPAFDWPHAPFPQLKYPLHQNVENNKREEQRCLADVERIISSWHFPVAALIVEPIQNEGGDKHASPAFFQGLRNITIKYGVTMIVDEAQTGFGSTDIVTFSKKAQTAGYFSGDNMLVPDKAFRQFSTWIGDPARVILCNAIISEILDKDLVAEHARVGAQMYRALEDLAAEWPAHISNLRGEGCAGYIAFDHANAAGLVQKMRAAAVNIGSCGTSTVRFRPMLIFTGDLIDKVMVALKSCIATSER